MDLMRGAISRILGGLIAILKTIVIFFDAVFAVILAGLTALLIMFIINYFPLINNISASSNSLTPTSSMGFFTSVFAKDLKTPRFLASDPSGNILVSIGSGGKIIALIDKNRDGISDGSKTILNKEGDISGITLKCADPINCFIFIEDGENVSVYGYDPMRLKSSGKINIASVPDDIKEEALKDLAISGQAKIPLDGWPKDYSGDLLEIDRDLYNNNFSKNHQIIRHNFDEDGNYMGAKDFFTGSPADLLVQPASSSFISDLYISDDRAGIIYRITYGGGQSRRFLEMRE